MDNVAEEQSRICIGMRRFWEREITVIRGKSDRSTRRIFTTSSPQVILTDCNRRCGPMHIIVHICMRVEGCDLHKTLAVSLAVLHIPDCAFTSVRKVLSSLFFQGFFLTSSRMKNSSSVLGNTDTHLIVNVSTFAPY